MVPSVLFICTGNICRSPVAEAVARQAFGDLGLGFHSAGLDAGSGLPASSHSAVYALETGTSLVDHRSRRITPEILDNTAWVIGMTRSHAALFRSRFGMIYDGGIGILGAPGVDLARRAHSPSCEEVSDPFGGSAAVYQLACEQIRRLLEDWEPVFREIADRKDTPT